MTNKQPEALVLAGEMDWLGKCGYRECKDAAAELRRLHQSEREGWRHAAELEQERKRLHELNAELVEALEAIMDLGDTSLQLIYPSREAADKAKAALRKAQGDNND